MLDGVERQKPVRAVTVAPCPGCTSGGRGLANLIGLVWVGDHLVWRDHTYPTWSGARIACRASGVAVCSLPPKVGFAAYLVGKKPAVCRHRAVTP